MVSHDARTHETEVSPDERHSDAVVRAIAAATGQSPLEMTPLYETVDPGAIDALFEDRTGTDPSLCVQFRAPDCVVSVTRSVVEVTPRDGS